MHHDSHYVVWFSLIVLAYPAASAHLSAAETAAAGRAFSAQEEAARQQVLRSAHWQTTRKKFKQWLAVQSAYDAPQLAKQEAQLKDKIASMSAGQLQQFLAAMDERLHVLLSPEMDQARSWVNHYYTMKGQRKLVQKLGAEQPLAMTGSQLQAALERFHAQRAAASQSASAFNRSRQTETKALDSYRTRQRSAQAKAQSTQRSATYGKHSSPQKLQQRPTRYPSGWRGGWGGWGGW